MSTQAILLADHQTKSRRDQTKRRNLMNTRQTQKTSLNSQLSIGTYWLWLGLGILIIVAALAIALSHRTEITVPVTGSPSQPQSVPDAAVQGVAGYIEAHSGPSAQSVPEAAAQGVAGYLQAHGTGLIITDPAQKSVMDYLRAHGVEVP
jgi:hypothetical protein